MESESKNIIQMLKNVKQIIEVSKERGSWKDEELKDIGITYHNVCEIYKQLEEKGVQENEPEPELDESMEEIN
jgi:hypothetical protein